MQVQNSAFLLTGGHSVVGPIEKKRVAEIDLLVKSDKNNKDYVMPTLTGTFETPNASKYLQQLCKHFSHKVDANFDEVRGFAALGFGATTFDADSDQLAITVALNDGADPLSAQQMIDAHLERFAFREEFKTMVWSQS